MYIGIAPSKSSSSSSSLFIGMNAHVQGEEVEFCYAWLWWKNARLLDIERGKEIRILESIYEAALHKKLAVILWRDSH